jgi:O-antigen/teichoic acid export membrane protein
LTKTLIKNSGIYFLTNLLSQGAVFILWFIIAGVLSPADVGIYALAIFIVDFFGAFAILGLNSTITRFYYSEEANEEIFFNSFLIFIISNIASLALLLFSINFISWLLPSVSNTLNNSIILFSLLIIASSFYNFVLSHYSALKKSFLYAKISLLQTVLFFGLSLIFLNFKFGILGIFYALFISYLTPSIVFLFYEVKGLSTKLFSREIIKSLLHYSVPMMLYSTLGTIVIYSGRIFLDRFASLSDLGIFSFFLVIVLQVNAIWATFNKAWTPEIFSQLKENKEKALENIKSMVFITSFFYSIFFILLLVLNQIGFLGLFLKPIYLENIYILYILLLAPIFTGIYTAVYPLFYYRKKTKIILIISVVLNFIDILITFYLVKNYGQIGAALSFSLVSALSLFVFLFSFKKDMNIPSKIIKWSLLVFTLIFIGEFLSFKFYSYSILVVTYMVVALLSYKFGSLESIKDFFALTWKDIKNKAI